MDELHRPTGTITFLFSDIEGSTELAAKLGPAAYRAILETHQRVLREAFARHGGVERGTEGDSFFVVFRDAPSAVAMAVDGQRGLAQQAWPTDVAVRVRMGMHTGQGTPGGDDYIGLDVNRAARIMSAAHGGQVLISDATRALTEHEMPDGVEALDLGSHRLRGLPDPEHIYQLAIGGLPAAFPAIRTGGAPPTNLPARTSSFVGRNREIEEVERAIAANALVTLIGTGGTGKTSLALEVARRVAPQFTDGAWFVALDAVADPQLVASSIVAGLGLRDVTGRPARERLLDNLPGRSLLLVLDNFEQVVEAASLVAEILAAAPTVKAIVTSRAPLRLTSEQLYPVGPLAVPPADGGIKLREIGAMPSVRLFVERAQRVRPSFVLTAANAEVIADICRRLDGLPLGIELAAARIGLLGPTDIRDRLAEHMAMGGAAARDAPARQRTLDDAIAWSHDLLDGREQTLFARLAVFAGGWRVAQAEETCGPGSEVEGQIPALLDGLVEQSLVDTTLLDDGVRFDMLQTIRRDADRRLRRLGWRDDLERRHAIVYLSLAERQAPLLDTREGPAAIARLEEERENLRAATHWAISTANVEVGLRLGRALHRPWALTGQIDEGLAALLATLALPGADEATVWRMRALEAAGNLFYYAGDERRPREMYRAQLQLAQGLSDRKGIADARYNLLFTEYGQADWQAALTEVEAIAAEYTAIGELHAAARVSWARAVQMVYGGRRAEAVAILERAADEYAELGDYGYLSQAAGMLTALSFELGDPASAARWQLEALTAATKAGNLPAVTAGLPQMAMSAFHLGRPAAAATILGAYESLSRRYGVRMPLNLQQSLATLDPPEQVRAALGAQAYDEARAAGHAMSIDDVIEFMIALASAAADAAP